MTQGVEPERPRPSARTLGAVHVAFPVGRGQLYVEGWLVAPSPEVTSVAVLTQGETRENAPFKYFRLKRDDVAKAHAGKVKAGLACFGYRVLIEYPKALSVPVGLRFEFEGGATHTQDFADRYSARLPRERKAKRLTEVPESYGIGGPIEADPSYRKAVLNAALSGLAEEHALANRVEGWAVLADGRLFLKGWIEDEGRIATPIRLRTPSGSNFAAEWLFRYTRPSEPERKGFILLAPLPSDGAPKEVEVLSDSDECVLELRADREISEIRAQLLSAYRECWSSLWGAPEVREAFEAKVTALIAEVDEREHGSVTVATELQFGSAPEAPRVSLVVPVYKHYELLRHQLAHFAKDPFICDQEIVLVLDSPDDADLGQLSLYLHQLHELYQVPTRLLVMSANGGFARACNAGAEKAQADFVLLLNSDVFPDTNGWLQSMLSCIEGDDSVGAVGARLLYEDHTIQHSGLSWRRAPEFFDRWLNVDEYKGLPAALAGGPRVEEAFAVTGACMLLRRRDFKAWGMLDTGYIRGDFEDTDFCLKLRARGLRVLCDHRVRLLHLEGASYESKERSGTFLYNLTRHHHRWCATIEQLMEGPRQVP